MTPAQIRVLAENLPHDDAGVCDTASEVLWACADLVEATMPEHEQILPYYAAQSNIYQALSRINEISP